MLHLISHAEKSYKNSSVLTVDNIQQWTIFAGWMRSSYNYSQKWGALHVVFKKFYNSRKGRSCVFLRALLNCKLYCKAYIIHMDFKCCWLSNNSSMNHFAFARTIKIWLFLILSQSLSNFYLQCTCCLVQASCFLHLKKLR